MIVKIELPTGVNWDTGKTRPYTVSNRHQQSLTPKLNPNPTPRAALALGMQEKNKKKHFMGVGLGVAFGLKERVGWG